MGSKLDQVNEGLESLAKIMNDMESSLGILVSLAEIAENNFFSQVNFLGIKQTKFNALLTTGII